MKNEPTVNATCAQGMSLVELLMAIGILGVTMMLIAAAFPAGVAMSVAVSDETTAQMAFQQALSVIRDNYSVSKVENDFGLSELASDTAYDVIPNDYLGINTSGNYDGPVGFDNREYEFAQGEGSFFSWSTIMRRMGTAGPRGNLHQVVVVVSRRGAGNARFVPDATVGGDEDDPDTWSDVPELRKVVCVAQSTPPPPTPRTLEIHPDDFYLVPSAGYIIDGETGTAYIIISRNAGGSGNPDTVTLLSEPPSDADITAGPQVTTTGNTDVDGRYFWLVPGECSDDGTNINYTRRSPAIRVFQAMLYLP